MDLPLHPLPTHIMKQSREIAPGVHFNSPRWVANPTAILLDSAIPLHSTSHLIPAKHSGLPYGNIATPAIFKPQSRELRKLRRAKVWRQGGRRDQQVAQMDEWFPDISNQDPPITPALSAEEDDVAMSDLSINPPVAPTKTVINNTGCPSSNIGNLSKLPGEIRNRIYRFAILEPDSKPVSVAMQPNTCSMGACLHSKVSLNLPGIASTCRQLRWETAPIFLAENTAFTFDDGVVQQCCVNNYLRTLGSYLDLIPRFNFQLKRPIWRLDQFVEYLTYNFTLSMPKGEDKDFALHQWEEGDREICQCQLDDLVARMNMLRKDVPLSKLVMDFVDSEEFADFVWRTRKTKQWTTHLPICKKCGEVYFNN